jgi:hypothetical protein
MYMIFRKSMLVLIVRQYGHLERCQQICKTAARVAKSDDAYGFSGKFCAAVSVPDPFSSSYLAHTRTLVIKQTEQHSEGMFRYCVPVTFRTAYTYYSTAYGIVGVDQFHPASQPGNPLEALRSLKDWSVDPQPRCNDQSSYLIRNYFN